ncbi:hypothetical protein ACFX2I_015975 [Malus domestica]
MFMRASSCKSPVSCHPPRLLLPLPSLPSPSPTSAQPSAVINSSSSASLSLSLHQRQQHMELGHTRGYDSTTAAARSPAPRRQVLLSLQPARLTPHFPKPRQPQVRQQQQQINQLHKQQFSAAVARNKTPTTSNGSVYSDHLPSTSSFATSVEKEHNMWNEVRSRLLLTR